EGRSGMSGRNITGSGSDRAPLTRSLPLPVMFRILAALLCFLAFLALWAFVIEPSRLVLRETRITLPSWPAGIMGMRVAVISDLHAGSPHITLEKINRIVETTNAARPDLILLPGDFVISGMPGGRFMEPEVIASALQGLRARSGVFATLGNHDWWYN